MFYLLFLLLILMGLVLYLSSLEGNYSIQRSQLINAEINTVFAKIRDLKSWADWSPWLMHEPETKLEFSANCNDEGGFYTWNGQRIGAGKLSHVKFDSPHRIDQKLKFTRPFKSLCTVGFELSEQNNQTEVTWFMQGKMPFLFRFMTERTKEMISKDYALGLAMLNGQLDAKAEYPLITFDGETTLESMYSLCEGFSGGLQAMEIAMKQSYPKLMAHIEQQQGDIAGAPFAAYHKANPKTMQFVCDMAIPVAEGISAGAYQLKTLGGGRYFKVTLKGDYKFLELAWYSAIAHVHMCKLKYDKSRASLEVYENDPEQVQTSNEIVTSIYVAIK